MDIRQDMCVIIATLDEAATIADLIEASCPFCAQVWVFDSQSGDGTAEIARAHGARVFSLSSRGKGRAIIAALRRVELPVTVFIDADGSRDRETSPRWSRHWRGEKRKWWSGAGGKAAATSCTAT